MFFSEIVAGSDGFLLYCGPLGIHWNQDRKPEYPFREKSEFTPTVELLDANVMMSQRMSLLLELRRSHASSSLFSSERLPASEGEEYVPNTSKHNELQFLYCRAPGFTPRSPRSRLGKN